jgi:hypothetical protein
MVPGSIPGGVTGDFFFRGFPQRNHVPWGRLSLWKWVPGISPGVKAAGSYGWWPTTLVVPNPLGHLGLLRDDLYLYLTVHLLLFCTMANECTIISNYHTPTCFDTIVLSSGSLLSSALPSYISISNNTVYNYDVSHRFYANSHTIVRLSTYRAKHVSSIHVKNVYAASTLIDFVRIVATKKILAYFIVK